MATVVGTSGPDVLAGDSFSNVLTGGAGNDTFVFLRSQSDTTVTDFGSTYFTATIAGSTETPPNQSAGSGTFSGVLNRAHTKFDFTATIKNLDFAQQTQATTDNIVAAHFHNAAPGVAGGIVYGFFGTPNNELDGDTYVNPGTGVVSGEWDTNEGNAGTTLTAQIPNLMAGNLYINFHTTVLPAGEVRGQVIPLDAGQDKIDLTDTHIGDFATLQQVMKDVSGNTEITVVTNGHASTLILQGVPLASVSASDFIFASAANGVQTGSAGADDLFGAGGSDSLSGAGGNDRIFAAAGADSIDGGDGNDSLKGHDGDDTIAAGAGDDSAQGNMGGDMIHGGDGNDSLYGGKGGDTLYGDAGADRLSGDQGADILFGGAGADRFVFAKGGGADWIADFNFAEGDRIQLATGTTYTVTAYQGQVLLDLGGGDTIGLVGVSPTGFSAADAVVFA
jgi:Ca2+-binding RTX toxin-like protein